MKIRNASVATLALIMAISFTGCGSNKVENESTTAQSVTYEEQTKFSYAHDPKDNPSAMADIIVNPDAVYGFSPNPESKRLGTYAEYDWTNPEVVADAKKERIDYHNSLESMDVMLKEMRSKGCTVEEIARAISTERNNLRLAACGDDEVELKKVKQSNLETYGNEFGPTPEFLFDKYGSWDMVIQKSFSSNAGMDACCGLYDDYYWLYVELGLDK